MKRVVFIVLAWIAPALAYGVPAQPRCEAPEPAGPLAPTALHGTIWVGRLYDDGDVVMFLADGTLHTVDPRGGQGSGTWWMDGNRLYFRVNNWVDYETLVVGDVMSGHGCNQKGQKCLPFLKRVAGGRQMQ
jgi:hypothetical protein